MELSQSQGMLPIARSTFTTFEVASYREWKRVGHGQPYHDCGKTLVFGCINVEDHNQANLDREVVGKVFVDLRRRTCLRAKCPVCYEKWAGKEAHRIEYRLGQWRSSGRVIHVVVSVPFENWYKDLGELRSQAYKYAKKVGVFGGSCIIHPERERCVYCGEYKDIQTKRCVKCGCKDFSWVFSPHFHLLGYGWIHGHKVSELYKKTGWVIKNLGVRDSVSATALYQLSHCGTHPTKHSITWFGALSYNKLKLIPEVREKKTCPLCKAELVKLFWVGEGNMPYKDEGEFFDLPENWIRGYRDYG